MAPEMLNNVMEWFANRGIVRGDAEGLAIKLSLGDVKKLNNMRKEINCVGAS